MNIRHWILLDSFVLCLQVFAIVWGFLRLRKSIDNVSNIALAVLQFFSIIPLYLITYKEVVSVSGLNVPRFIFWHFKGPAGLSINDLLLIGVFLTLFLATFSTKRIPKLLLADISICGSFILLGIFSCKLNPYFFNSGGLLFVFRNSLSFIVGMLVAWRLARNDRDGLWLRIVILVGVVNVCLGAASLLCLTPDARWTRFFVPNFLPTQHSLRLGAIALVLVLSKRAVGWRAPLFVVAAALPLINLYKAAYFIVFGIFAAKFISFVIKTKRLGRVVLLVCLGLYALVPVVLVWIWTSRLHNDHDALVTRYYQMVNVVDTVWSGNLPRKLFGVGWKQPYGISRPFPFFDTGAWGEDDLIDPELKINVQIFPFSIIRSIGFLGAAGLIAWLISVLKKSLRGMEEAESLFFAGAVSVVFIANWLSFGEGSAEGVMLNAAVFFYYRYLHSANAALRTQRPDSEKIQSVKGKLRKIHA